MKNNAFSTLVEATQSLKKQGFETDFEIENETKMKIVGKSTTFLPSQVSICEFHRFEGATNPSDTSIIYALETENGFKGTLVDAYGADASEKVGAFLKQVQDNSKD